MRNYHFFTQVTHALRAIHLDADTIMQDDNEQTTQVIELQSMQSDAGSITPTQSTEQPTMQNDNGQTPQPTEQPPSTLAQIAMRQQAEFNPLQYVPSSQAAQIRSEIVRMVSTVAYPLRTEGAIGNHWCFHLTTIWNKVIQIDPTPSGIQGSNLFFGSKAYIVISDLSSSHQYNYDFKLDMESEPNLTVGDFVDALVENGCHKYQFSIGDRGCRKWMYDQVGLFSKKGYIEAPWEADGAKAMILRAWSKHYPILYEHPLDIGFYYE